MSEEYLAPPPIATWNGVRGVWETSQLNLLCGHWEAYLETWQTSGILRGGQVFELPTPERRTTVTVSSSLPTPTVSDQYTGSLKSTQQKDGSLHSVTLAQIVNRADLLPTPIVDDSKNNGANEKRIQGLSSVVYQTEVKQDWGRFQPAITSWESVTGREAPNPTKPDARDGSRRLSSAFAEWLMGVPKGWITGVGLTREQELKAAGNGVVPQQAYLALEILLGAKS